jgi:anti-anti-sigma factor
MSPELNPFAITTIRGDDGVTVVELTGDLDLPVAPDLERALASIDGAGPVIVDLTELRFMDSSGLRTVLITAERFSRSGIRWSLVVAPGSAVSRLLSLSEVEDQLPIHRSSDEARSAVAGGGP